MAACSGTLSGRAICWVSALAASVVLAQATISLAAAEAQINIVGDVLEISVSGVPELRQRAAVNADGEIFLPLLGGIKVIGLPLADVRSNVRELIQTRSSGGGPPRAVRTSLPSIPMRLPSMWWEQRPVYLNGDVSRPGEQRYRLGLTVRQAIALAGGYDIMRFRMIP